MMNFLRHFYHGGEHSLFLRKTGVCATVRKLSVVPSPLKPQREHPFCSCSVTTMFMTARVRRSRARSEHLVLLHLPAPSATNTRPTKQSAAPAKPGQCHFSTLSKPSATKGPQQCEAAHRAISTSTAGHAECDEAGYPALSAPSNLICCFFTLRAAYFLNKMVQKQLRDHEVQLNDTRRLMRQWVNVCSSSLLCDSEGDEAKGEVRHRGPFHQLGLLNLLRKI